MCFAPPRRALFRHLNLQKWSVHGVFCTFWLRNVLRATTACTFSTSQLPKVVRGAGVFCTFWLRNVLQATTACTFSTSQLPKVSENGVFCTFWLGNVLRATTACNFSSLLWPSWLRTRRFSEPTFRPSGATNHWKNTVNRDFPTFSRISIFFLLTLSLLLFSLLIFLFSLPLPCSAFHLSILSEVWLLNFLRSCHTDAICAIWANNHRVSFIFAGTWNSICRSHQHGSTPWMTGNVSLTLIEHWLPLRSDNIITAHSPTKLQTLTAKHDQPSSFSVPTCLTALAKSSLVSKSVD